MSHFVLHLNYFINMTCWEMGSNVLITLTNQTFWALTWRFIWTCEYCTCLSL